VAVQERPPVVVQTRLMTPAAAFWKWFWFGAAIGVVPILATMLWAWWWLGISDWWSPAIGHGQLLIAAVGLSGATISRFIGDGTATGADWCLSGLAVILALLGIVLFTTASLNPMPLDPKEVARLTSRMDVGSLAFYGCVLVVGGLSLRRHPAG
jgi:hypothetical protein